MALRFFADHCIPGSLIDGLRGGGHEVARLREHIAVESPDPIVLAKAQELGCILVSLNGDFADIVTYPPEGHGGIVAVQLRNQPGLVPALLGRLVEYMSRNPEQAHYAGKLLVLEAHRIRVWQ